MSRNAMRRNLRQTIKKTLGRYIAIGAIIALGAGLFVGLLMTKSDMVATGQRFMDESNMFDLRILNSYGWTEDYLAEIAAMEEVVDLEPVQYLDLVARMGEEGQEDSVYRFMAIPQVVNRIKIQGGRMPEGDDECVIIGYQMDDDILDTVVTVSEDNEEDSLESIRRRSFTVVGYVSTPLYMDMNRGTTTVGSGSLANVLYVRPSVLDMDYFQEINITLAVEGGIYTDEYSDAVEDTADAMEDRLQVLADRRLAEVHEEAMEEYKDGLNELNEGRLEYWEGKAEANEELADALQELQDGEQELLDAEELLRDGEEQIREGRKTLLEGEKTLQKSKQTLASTKADAYKQMSLSTQEFMLNMKDVSEELELVEAERREVDLEITTLNTRITPLETNRNIIDSNISQIDSNISMVQTQIDLKTMQMETADDAQRQQLEEEIAQLEQDKADYQAQRDAEVQRQAEIDAELEPLYEERAALQQRSDQLSAREEELSAQEEAFAAGLLELTMTEAVMNQEFAAADAQIAAAEAQIQEGKLELELRSQEIEDGWEELKEGKQELKDGWKEYEEGKAEAEAELADGWQKLLDGEEELADGWDTICNMTENEIMLLSRTSNVGYNNLDSASDIVQGVSRVIPVFFILVASLVCITTMTRMIDEERTQIGTLKALGYGNAAIISKYLFYSGSGALIGCGLGIAMGCSVFPSIIWQAYKIMLYIDSTLVLLVNWPMAIGVTVLYTTILLLVTWYCCRRALQEVPAELIRPKAPDPGKKLLIEKLPFWRSVSFLNKVTIRNIFRYKQRLAMMLVGIGGCTALLLTGFGLRDSIVNVVDYQFQEVTHYDLEVYFRDEVLQEEQSDFRSELGSEAERVLFYHQSSVDIVRDSGVKKVYMICAGDGLEHFLDLHTGSRDIPLPQKDQVVLSVGVAEALGIREGDFITLRNADMESMEVTVSGIYDNHVYNYCIISPQTYQSQLGKAPQQQMAFVKTAPGADAHALSARAMEVEGVMNVAVSEDMAEMVGSMMDALDLVVWVIVFCAGLLAVIVLYNLTNININERIREIATIKVLGFHAGETGAYVFKENMVLTVVGSVLGLGLGYLMLLFVMAQIKIDMVWFKPLIMLRSYIWSIALTILSAVVVDFIFYFKLDKINMAEALKSVE